MTKKETLKLKPGCIIELSWDNCVPTTKAILLEKPINRKGDIYLKCIHQLKNGNIDINSHAYHSQIVKIISNNGFNFDS